MKKQTTTTLEDQVDFTVKQLIQTSDQKHHLFLDRVRTIAHTLAQSLLPPKNAPSLLPFVEELLGFYERERTNVLVMLASGIQAILTSIGISELVNQIDDKKEEAEAHRRTMNNKKHEHDGIRIQRDVEAYKTYRVVLWIFTIVESCWLALIFSGAFNDSNLMVALGAIAISFFLVQTVKIYTLYVRDRGNEPMALWVKICAPLFIIGVVVSLGMIRYTSVLITTEETITTYRYLNHPVMFMIITMIPIIGAGLIVWRYYLSKDELKMLREREQLAAEYKEEEQLMLACTQQVKLLTAHRNDIAQARVKCRHAEQVLVQRFDGYAKEALGIFKLENVKHRKDNVYPDCFTHPLPKLSPVQTMEPFDITPDKQLS